MTTSFSRLASRRLPWAVVLVAQISVAHADAVRLDVSRGQNIDLYAVLLQLDRKSPIHEFEDWILTGHVDFAIGLFHGQKATTGGVAVIGKLRWQRREPTKIPFIEAGFGLSDSTSSMLGGTRRLGGHFEFTELVRLGYRMGTRRQFEVALYGEHFSNAGLGSVNEGVTYGGLSLAYYFR